MSGAITPKYMKRFACIGPACEDTCCRGWRVTIDEKSYHKLQALMQAPDERAEFERKVTRLPLAKANPMAYATAKTSEDGSCQWLKSDDLCSIHERYGHDALSNTCAMYPRQLRVSDSAVELTGLVSCPEVARQLLLHEDSMDLESIESEELGRQLSCDKNDEGDMYGRYLDDVRNAMIQMALLREFTIDERLFFMAFFAQKTVPFFHQGTKEDPGPRLAQILDQMARPAVQQGIAAELARVTVPLSVTATLASEIGHVGRPVSPSFAALAERVFATLHSCHSDTDAAVAGFDPEKLSEMHRMRKQRLHQLAGPQIDAITERFVLNYWVQRWYTKSPNLLAHVRELVIEVAVQQLLLCSHPDLPAQLTRYQLAVSPVEPSPDVPVRT